MWASSAQDEFPYDSSGFIDSTEKESIHPQKKEISVISWNIAYAHGLGSNAYEYQPRDFEVYRRRLLEIADFINRMDPDVVLLQEVDFYASRSHFVNQLEFLSNNTKLKHSAGALGWSANYIPFPYWPVSRQLGRMASGGGILSKFPIESQVVEHYLPPAEFSFWYSAFYLRRYSQYVTLPIGGRRFGVINSHLEDKSVEANQRQAQSLLERLGPRVDDVELLVLGGDFNARPESPSLSVISNSPFLGKALTTGETFPSDTPTSRLDYLFHNKTLRCSEYRVASEAGILSDHLPVLMRVVLGE